MIDVAAQPGDVSNVGGPLVGQHHGPEALRVGDDEPDDAVDRRDGNVPVVRTEGVGLDQPAIDAAHHPQTAEPADRDAAIDRVELVHAEQRWVKPSTLERLDGHDRVLAATDGHQRLRVAIPVVATLG
jgi:hypothetical protein